MGKKKPRRWNRAHKFMDRKPTNSTEGHPSLIFATSGQLNKYLAFTHSPTTNGKENLPLEENIDSNDGRKCYVRDVHLTARKVDFDKPSAEYSLKTQHDKDVIKKLRNKKF